MRIDSRRRVHRRPTAARAVTRRSRRVSRTSWRGRPTSAAIWPTGGTGTPRAGGRADNACAADHPPAMSALTMTGVDHVTAIRANSILPARREDIELHTADGLHAGGRAGAAGGPRSGRDDRLPASAAHARRHDGQPRVPQGRVAAAGAGRGGRAAVQHPGHGQCPRHQRGRIRRRRGGALRRGGRDRVRGVRRPAVDLAGGLVVRHRSGAEVRLRPERRRRDPAVAAAALLDPQTTSPSGTRAGKPVVALVPEFDDYLRPAEAREQVRARSRRPR